MDLISTIGPASWSDNELKSMLNEGVSCFRFPFSKENPETHLNNGRRVRKLASDLGLEIGVMADLPGAKPRLSNEHPIEVNAERTYRISLTSGAAGADLHLTPPLAVAPRAVTEVEALLGDGDLSFHIESLHDSTAIGRFTLSGTLERRQAFTIPGVSYRVRSFTEQDQAYCETIANDAFDCVALSFVQDRADVDRARAWLSDKVGWRPRLIAKIESVDGVRNAAEIASAADAVMIARGDLALQIGFENLWAAQRAIIEACHSAGTYVIAATGFLESLVRGRRPARSEAIDVATATDLGVGALMLSAETTIGVDPLNAIRTLKRLVAGVSLPSAGAPSS